MKKLFSMLLSCAVGSLVLLSAQYSVAASDSPQAYPLAPAFSGETLRGKPLKFTPRNSSSINSDQPTLLVFWASWCGVCMTEVPALKTAFAERADQLQIIGINLDKTPSKGLAVVQERQLPYPSVKDGDLLIADQYEVSGTPTLYVIGASGNILYRANRLHKALAFIDNMEPR